MSWCDGLEQKSEVPESEVPESEVPESEVPESEVLISEPKAELERNWKGKDAKTNKRVKAPPPHRHLRDYEAGMA